MDQGFREGVLEQRPAIVNSQCDIDHPTQTMADMLHLINTFGDFDGIKALEKELLARNAEHKDWECTEKLIKQTHEGSALYMHCLPADITGVSCKEGEVCAGVFDRYRVPMYKQAGYKPYIIAAMILLSKIKYPTERLNRFLEARSPRIK